MSSESVHNDPMGGSSAKHSVPADPDPLRADFVPHAPRADDATARPPYAAALDRLVTDLQQVLAASIESNQESLLADCVALATTIGDGVDDLQRRLDHAETYLHEQTLQTQAHRKAARTDGLTGVANRRAFDIELAERCDDAFRSGAPVSLVLFDIDHFKRINDVFGHTMGDAILRGVALTIRGALPQGCSLARYGGEEFALILPGIFVDHAVRVADELREAVKQTIFRYEGQCTRVTLSCGVAQHVAQDHWSSLLQRADAALYASKQAGRDRTHWHDAKELRQAAQIAGEASVSERTMELDHGNNSDAVPLALQGASPRSRGIPGVARGNWCDSSMLFWYLRQRIAEWRRGGEPFTLLAIDVDDRGKIKTRFGSRALHFVQRAQLLHLDASLRDMDVVGRLVESRVAVVLPRTPLDEALPLLARLIHGADRFAYPAGLELLEYSISVGVTSVREGDDASQLVKRAEEALLEAQHQGRGTAYLHEGASLRWLDLTGARPAR